MSYLFHWQKIQKTKLNVPSSSFFIVYWISVHLSFSYVPSVHRIFNLLIMWVTVYIDAFVRWLDVANCHSKYRPFVLLRGHPGLCPFYLFRIFSVQSHEWLTHIVKENQENGFPISNYGSKAWNVHGVFSFMNNFLIFYVFNSCRF